MYSEIMATIQEQFDSSENVVVIEMPEDIDTHTFRTKVIPLAVGFASSTHGLTAMSHRDKTLTFTRLCEEEIPPYAID